MVISIDAEKHLTKLNTIHDGNSQRTRNSRESDKSCTKPWQQTSYSTLEFCMLSPKIRTQTGMSPLPAAAPPYAWRPGRSSKARTMNERQTDWKERS